MASLEMGVGPGDEGWPLEVDEWPLTRSEEAVLEFGRAVEMARATDEAESGEAVRRVGMGEVRKTVTTTKYEITEKDGEVVRRPIEETVRVEELPPDAAVQMARLERMYPERWGKVDRQETTVSGTVEHKIVDPKDVIDRMRKRLEEAEARGVAYESDDSDSGEVDPVVPAIETTATESGTAPSTPV